jgi:hypothetical protein
LNDLAIHPLLERLNSSRLRDLRPVEVLEIRRQFPAEFAARVRAEAELRLARHDAELQRLDREFADWRREALEAAEVANAKERLDRIGQ